MVTFVMYTKQLQEKTQNTIAKMVNMSLTTYTQQTIRILTINKPTKCYNWTGFMRNTRRGGAGDSNSQLLSSHGDTLREKPQADDDSQHLGLNQTKTSWTKENLFQTKIADCLWISNSISIVSKTDSRVLPN